MILLIGASKVSEMLTEPCSYGLWWAPISKIGSLARVSVSRALTLIANEPFCFSRVLTLIANELFALVEC